MRNQELIDSWICWKASGNTAPSTIRKRRYQLEAFAREYELEHATLEQITEYISRPSRQASAKKGVRSALRSFYGWAYAAGILDHDPTVLTHPIRDVPGLPKPVPVSILEYALAHADRDTGLILRLGAYAGLRRAEIAGLHSDHVTDFGLYITGKGSKQRRIPIHPKLRPALAFTGWAFPGRYPGTHVNPDWVAVRMERALQGHTTHSLRHYFATEAYRATRDLRAVQTLLGHASPTTTARYVLLDDDALDRAVAAIA